MSASLFSEIRRRRVPRVAALYILTAWVILQVSDLAFPGLYIPDSAIRYVWIGVIACFPPALILGWRFDIKAGRLVRTPDGNVKSSSIISRGDFALLTVILIGVSGIWIAVIAAVLETRTFPSEESAAPVALAKSIAVLPFENLSGDPANIPFTMGIHDDVLTHVSKVSDIKVISRTSVMRLDRTMGIPAISELLGVATVLEGGVQRSGDRIRINAQLIDAASDQHLWSESFDRELTTDNIFAIQSDIAAAIAERLRATLSAQDKLNLDRRPTTDLEAYEAYLLGKQSMARRSRAGLLRAVEYFESAVALDGEYTLAHVGIATASLLLANYGHLPLEDALLRADPALAIALELDDKLGAAQAALGLRHAQMGQADAAREAFDRAIELDPNSATPYHWNGDVLITRYGDPESAIPLLQKARSLDPLSPVIAITLGEAFDAVGKFDDSFALYEKAREIDNEFPGAYLRIGLFHRNVRGDFIEAVRAVRQELAIDPARTPSVLSMSFLELGDAMEAERWVLRGLQVQPDGFWTNADKTFLHRYRGEEDAALESARHLFDMAPGNNVSLVTLVNYGKYEEALSKFLPLYPELSCDREPAISRINGFQAINLSLALEETGEQECAERLLNAVLLRLPDVPRLGMHGYGIADVEIYSRQGRIRLALDTLRRAIDDGYRAFWWAQGPGSPHMTALLGNPEFEAMMDEIRLDMADQLSTLRQLEANGKLPVVPDLPDG